MAIGDIIVSNKRARVLETDQGTFIVQRLLKQQNGSYEWTYSYHYPRYEDALRYVSDFTVPDFYDPSGTVVWESAPEGVGPQEPDTA